MKDEPKVEHFDELLPNLCSTVASMKQSLHARKWASIQKRGSQSTTSGAHTPNLTHDGASTDEESPSFLPVIEACQNIPVRNLQHLKNISLIFPEIRNSVRLLFLINLLTISAYSGED